MELVREYLDFDFPTAEQQCDECPYSKAGKPEDCRHPKTGKPLCKVAKVDEYFPETFRTWVGNLTRLHQWHKAGYGLEEEGLGFSDWQALAEITRWYQVRDLQVLIPQKQNG